MIKNIDPNLPVQSVARLGNALYVGGGFTVMNGVGRNYFTSFNLTTGGMNEFAPSFDGPVLTICAGTSKIAIGGSFNNLTYNGVSLSNLRGIVVYDPNFDTFNTVNSLIASPPNPVPGGEYIPGTPPYSISKIKYHISTQTFYAGGRFLFNFVDSLGSTVKGITGLISFNESTLVPNNTTTRYAPYVLPIPDPPNTPTLAIGQGIRSILPANDFDIDQSGNRIFIAFPFVGGPPNLQPGKAYNISNPTSLVDLNWYPLWSSFPANLQFADGKIWIEGTNLGGYSPTIAGPNVLISHIAAIDPNTFQLVSPSGGANPYLINTSNFQGGLNVTKIYDDGTSIFFFGNFWGIGAGPLSTDVKQNISIAKFNKPNYSVTTNEQIDLRYNTVVNYITSFTSTFSCSITDVYLEDGKFYLFGAIPWDCGFVRPNPYTPYIINADGSKYQKEYIGVI